MNNKKLVFLILGILVVGGGITLFYALRQAKPEVNSFEECAAAGYGVMESYPRQCRTRDGKHFTEEVPPIKVPTPVRQGLPNPAAVYCEEQGGRLETREREGGVDAACIFDDGSECGQWDFFRGDCQKGERFCQDFCGDQKCQEIVCQAVGCPCAESLQTCPEDCQ